MLEIVKQISEDEWKRFLNKRSDATLYHTPEWRAFLEKTFGYEPTYLFATDKSGQLTGILPLFYVKSRLTGNRLCSAPFSHDCGCLGGGFVRSALIDEALALKDKFRVDGIEIRSAVDDTRFQEKNTFCTHVLELSQRPEETWKRLDRSSVRWAIKKAERSGVSVASSKNEEDLKEFYELNCITKQKLGVPCHPWNFFKDMFSILDGHVQMYLSRHEGCIIAGGIMEYYKDQVLYGYGAANPKCLDLHPYNAFIWKSIEDACLNGYRTYDFGRTSYDNAGLINFKKKWGTKENEMHYSFYPAPSESFVANRKSKVYRLGNSVIRLIPMPAYKALSTAIFSHFG
jgi:CelD/BcsL family acetyltransferase involved in cellulose biosynthesis